VSSHPHRSHTVLSGFAVLGLLAAIGASPAAAATARLHVKRPGVSAALTMATRGNTVGATVVTVQGTLRLRQRGTLVVQACRTARCTTWVKPGWTHKFPAGTRRSKLSLTLAKAPAVRVTLVSGKYRRTTLLAGPAPPPAATIHATAPTTSGTPPTRGTPSTAPVPAFAITTSAGLTPAYDPSLPDYTVACGSSGSVTVEATVVPGQSLSINGGPSLTGTVRQEVPLQADQAFTFALTAAGSTSTDDVRCTPPDFAMWNTQVTGTPQVQWMAFAPPGGSPLVGGGLYAVIADSWGVPVWWERAPAGSSLLNPSVLPNGNVAFWVPNGAGDGQIGYYSINTLDATSPLSSGLPDDVMPSTADGYGEEGSNLHDFEQLSNGNYLLIATVPRRGVNLIPFGINSSSATVIDAVIQEITPSGQLVWSWDSADHISHGETDWGFAGKGTTWDGQPAYDIIHMNSIQMLETDNCLAAASCDIVFSARHLDAVYSINMATGDTNWKLGGTTVPNESLTFVGDPDGNFSAQHFAVILPNGTLTVHDNGSLLSRPPRAVNYSISPTAMTATFLSQVSDGRAAFSGCCGSASLLPGGDWLASWGGNSIIAEMTPTGAPVLSLTFPNGGSSYRVYPVADSALINRGALIAGMNSQFAAGPAG
jgi:Arylsulfotransferase (ASST)